MAVINITKENFAQEVLHSEKPVLLDFWASWCGPCRMLSPVVDEVAEERTDVKVGKVNVDEQPDLAAQFGVMSIPTLLVFEQGKLVRQAVGARPKAGVLELLGLIIVLNVVQRNACGRSAVSFLRKWLASIQKNHPRFYKWNHETKAKEKQKIQHNFHPSGRTCTEGHGMNDKKIDLTPAAIIACLFKAVPDFQR